MIGIDIKIPNQYGNYLYAIFKGIDLLNFEWEINTDDSIFIENDEIKEGIFNNANVLNGQEFLKCISRNSYFVIFTDIKAYPLGSNRLEINTFEDFLASNCRIILLCNDSMFIEFYSKNQGVLEKVYNNCIANAFNKVEYKYSEDVLGRSFVAF